MATLKQAKARYWSDPEKRRKEALQRYYRNREKRLVQMADYDKKLKEAAFQQYGGAKCNCCGETEEHFLTIDHVDGGGNEHRRSLKGGGTYICRWLKKENYPLGFQVLCMNCNHGKSRNGNRCPHANVALLT